MNKTLTFIFITLGLIYLSPAFSCENNTSCDECNEESEYSWNPYEKFVTERLERFYALEDEINAAYLEGKYVVAEKLIVEYLKLANIYRCNWNYGNAIHYSNRILGLISLKKGNIDKAIKHLLDAGKSTGSPQLNSFGPNLDLANELLKLGKYDTVKIYLKDIAKFWEMDDGRIDNWLKEIDNGEIPVLNRYSGSGGVWHLLIYWLTVMWPFFISITYLISLRKKIQRKLYFVVVSIIAGYIVMFIVKWATTYAYANILDKLIQSGNEIIMMVGIFVVMSSEYILPLLAVFIVSRLFIKYERKIHS